MLLSRSLRSIGRLVWVGLWLSHTSTKSNICNGSEDKHLMWYKFSISISMLRPAEVSWKTESHRWNGSLFCIAYMVMELGDENLNNLIERSHSEFPDSGGPGLYTPPAIRKRIWSQIVGIISTLHANNTVHMDLKPDNFLVFGRTLKIADLGISKKAHMPGYDRTSLRCSMSSLFPSLTF